MCRRMTAVILTPDVQNRDPSIIAEREGVKDKSQPFSMHYEKRANVYLCTNYVNKIGASKVTCYYLLIRLLRLLRYYGICYRLLRNMYRNQVLTIE